MKTSRRYSRSVCQPPFISGDEANTGSNGTYLWFSMGWEWSAMGLGWSGRRREGCRCFEAKWIWFQILLPPQPQASDFISEPQFSHLQSGDNDSYFTELSGGWHTLAGEAPGTRCRSWQAEAPEMSSGYTWGHTIEGLPSDHARNLRAQDDLCHKEWGVCPRSTPTFWLGVKDDRVTPVTPGPLVGGAGLGPRPHLQLVAGAFKKLQGKKGDAS